MIVTESSPVDPAANILLIGDLLIDRTYYVDVLKLSPEAPVPVATLTGDPIETPGGAGLAAAFAAANKIPTIFGAYTSLVRARQISVNYKIPFIYPGDIYDKDLNVTKTRYIDNETHYHLLRVDNDRVVPPPFKDNEEEQWFNQVEKVIASKTIKVLALLDYQKGLLNEARSQRLINIARNANIPVYVDTRCHNLTKFNGINILKLNKEEFVNACRFLNISDDSLEGPGTYDIIHHLGLEHLIVTCGAEGARMFTPTVPWLMPCYAHSPEYKGSLDVTGCGDVFDVTFCYHWGINKISAKKALQYAVDRATKFAHEPIGERLQWQK